MADSDRPAGPPRIPLRRQNHAGLVAELLTAAEEALRDVRRPRPLGDAPLHDWERVIALGRAVTAAAEAGREAEFG